MSQYVSPRKGAAQTTRPLLGEVCQYTYSDPLPHQLDRWASKVDNLLDPSPRLFRANLH